MCMIEWSGDSLWIGCKRRLVWNLGSDARSWCELWWVALRGAENSRTSDSLNCTLGCAGTCRSKVNRWWLALCSRVFCDLGEGWDAWRSHRGMECCNREMCWSLLLGRVSLNLGCGNFKFHDEMSRQSSAIKYAEWFNSKMKKVILEVTACGGVVWILTTMQVLR